MSITSGFRLLAILGMAMALVTACTAAPTVVPSAPTPTSSAEASPRPGASVSVPGADAQVLTSDLVTLWSIAFLEDSALISSRDTGQILEVVGETTRVVGTIPDVVQRGESGLLGIAVDGQRRLYAYSTAENDNRIQRFSLSGEPGSLRMSDPELIVSGIPAASYHDGGRLAFGPDGMLYATTGDAGQRSAAQDLDSLGGKILRMTTDGEVPDDNPFPGSLVFSLGHRNPQGIAWDESGRMFATEFGQDTWDELNIIEAGANYGWPTVEGAGGGEPFVDPVQQWNPDEASPSGMAIVDGSIFIANLRGQSLRSVPVADPSMSNLYFATDYGRFRDVVLAPDGSLWALTSNTDSYGSPSAGDDRLLRVELTERNPAE